MEPNSDHVHPTPAPDPELEHDQSPPAEAKEAPQRTQRTKPDGSQKLLDQRIDLDQVMELKDICIERGIGKRALGDWLDSAYGGAGIDYLTRDKFEEVKAAMSQMGSGRSR